MATVSVTLPTDGTTADVTDYNTPLTTIVTEINGNLDNANIKSNAAIATSKLADDAGITGAKLATNAVAAANLATSAITLGYASITANITGVVATSATQITGLTSTVTIPAGGRRVRVSFYCSDVFISTAANFITISLWDGTVGSGTQIGRAAVYCSSAGLPFFVSASAIVTPAAGPKTYNVGIATNSAANAANLEAAATYPAYILVEAI